MGRAELPWVCSAALVVDAPGRRSSKNAGDRAAHAVEKANYRPISTLLSGQFPSVFPREVQPVFALMRTGFGAPAARILRRLSVPVLRRKNVGSTVFPKPGAQVRFLPGALL